MIIIKPVLSTKSALALENKNIYTFLVSPKATKFQIRNEVEQLFQVKVKKIRTLCKKPVLQKTRYLRRAPRLIYTKLQKKAIIELFPGQEIKNF